MEVSVDKCRWFEAFCDLKPSDPLIPLSGPWYQTLVRCPRKACAPRAQGPSKEVVAAVVEMKRRNPRFGCRKIAEQIAQAFGIEIDKDTVRRILAKHYHPDSDAGPSQRVTLIVFSLGFVLLFAGCEKEGTAAKAERQMDQAAQQAGEKAIEAGKTVGEKVEKAGE